MKKIIISILIGMMLVFTPLACALNHNKLIVKTDRFTGITSKSITVKPAGMLRITAANFNNNGDTRLYLSIVFKSRSWKYLRCNMVDFIVDGKRLSPDTDYDGIVGEVRVFEYISLSNDEEIRTILEGTNVEFKICNDEYEIPIEQLKLLRQVLN